MSTDKHTVLIIDDEKALLFTICEALGIYGYEVLLASTGAEGIEILQNNQRIDAILMDKTMPGMDGFNVLEQLKDLSISVPTIVSSGYFDAEDEQSFKELGVYACLAKPYSIQKLIELLGEIVTSA